MRAHSFNSSEKTILLTTYKMNSFPGEYTPPGFDNYSANITVNDKCVGIYLQDTTGQEDYRKLRPLAYQHTDVFLLTFSLVLPRSLENIENMWYPEVKENIPDAKFVLVGLNSSFRDNFSEHYDEYHSRGLEPIPTEEGEKLCKKLKLHKYMECDADTMYNIKEVFMEAFKIVLNDDSPSQRNDSHSEKKKRRKKKKKKLKVDAVEYSKKFNGH